MGYATFAVGGHVVAGRIQFIAVVPGLDISRGAVMVENDMGGIRPQSVVLCATSNWIREYGVLVDGKKVG